MFLQEISGMLSSRVSKKSVREEKAIVIHKTALKQRRLSSLYCGTPPYDQAKKKWTHTLQHMLLEDYGARYALRHH